MFFFVIYGYLWYSPKNQSVNRSLQVVNTLRNFFHVNTELLPMKLIFFFTFGGFAAVLPFMSLIAKQLGINATAVGIGYSVIPIFIFISNPIVGFLVDYFQNIKIFLIVLVISSSAIHSSVLSLPPITHTTTEDAAYVQIFYYNDSEYVMNISTPFDRSCLEKILRKEIQCELVIEYGNLTAFNDTNVVTHLSSSIIITYNANESDTVSNKKLMDSYWVNFYLENNFVPEMRNENISLKSFRCSPSIHHCSISTDSTSVFSTYQFWTFFTLVIIGGMTWISCMTLCCVACCEILGTQIEYYGRQRLFGTISSGVITSLAGILNDNLASSEKSYIPGFYLMAGFLTIDIIILCVIHIPKAHVSTNMCTDIKRIFSSKETVVFSLGVALIGFLATIISMYEFWFLQDIGANQTLLGLSVAIQCLMGEVPFLFFSGWFVNKFGHFLCLVIAFAGFVARFMLYSTLQDPWLVLPIDLLHGLTYGIYHGAMASFVKIKAPKGMEATLLGFYGGLYDGFGHGIGSFVGGLGLDKLGARKTFFTSSILSLGCLLSFLLASYVFRASRRGTESQASPQEREEFLQNDCVTRSTSVTKSRRWYFCDEFQVGISRLMK